MLTRAACCPRMFPYDTTPITSSVYLPNPGLVQLTGPAEAWGPPVPLTSGGGCSKPPPILPAPHVPLRRYLGPSMLAPRPALLVSGSLLYNNVWS